MKFEDVKIGDKVVPFQKTVKGYQDFTSWKKANNCHARFFKDNGFLYVNHIREDTKNVFGLSQTNEVRYGDFFNASDFEPYIETKKQGFSGYFQGNKTVVFVDKKQGEANYNPEDETPCNPLIGLLLAYCRATDTDEGIVDLLFKKPVEIKEDKRFESSHFNIGDAVNVLDGSFSLINRNSQWKHVYGVELKRLSFVVYAVAQKLPSTDADEINDTILQDTVTGDLLYIQERCLSLKDKEDKPTFEVGERVRVREDLIAEKMYDGCSWYDGCSCLDTMASMGGEVCVITDINKYAKNRYYLNGKDFPNWSPAMLEKIPQPSKETASENIQKILDEYKNHTVAIEVFADGVKYVRSEE
jgi:transcription antitermination factor NusG